MPRIPAHSELRSIFPDEVLDPPLPLVFVMGASSEGDGPAHGDRLQSLLEGASRDTSATHPEMPPLKVVAVPLQHAFPPKKPLRDEALRGPDGRPSEAYNIGGILKANWLPKHHSLIPAVVLVALPFKTGLTPSGYAQQEDAIFSQLDRVRQQLAARESQRLMLVLLRSNNAGNKEPTSPLSAQSEQSPQDHPLGGSSPPLELSAALASASGGSTADHGFERPPGEVGEQRLLELRRRLGLDSKMLVVLGEDTLTDKGTAASPIVTRLHKHTREYAHAYYLAQARRVKRWEKALVKHSQAPLAARYSFKVGTFYEFQGNSEKAMRYYRAAYDHLAETSADSPLGGFNHASAPANLPWANQRRGAASFIALKLVASSWLSTVGGNSAAVAAGEAEGVAAARRHLALFRSPSRGDDLALHFSWLATQHKVFGLLLEARSLQTRQSPLSSSVAAKSGFLDPAYYFDAAAALEVRRREAALTLSQKQKDRPQDFAIPEDDSEVMRLPPTFVGNSPRLIGWPTTPQEADLSVRGLWQKELNEDHLTLTTSAISRVVKEVEKGVAGGLSENNPRKRRKRVQLLSLLGGEQLAAGNHADAFHLLGQALSLGSAELSKWPFLSLRLLLQMRTCAVALGKRRELLELSWRLLAKPYKPFLKAQDRATIAKDLFAALASKPQTSSVTAKSSMIDDGNDGSEATSNDGIDDEVIVKVAKGSSREVLEVQPLFRKVREECGRTVAVTLRVDSWLPVPMHLESAELVFEGDAAPPATILDTASEMQRDALNTKSSEGIEQALSTSPAVIEDGWLVVGPKRPLVATAQVALPTSAETSWTDYWLACNLVRLTMSYPRADGGRNKVVFVATVARDQCEPSPADYPPRLLAKLTEPMDDVPRHPKSIAFAAEKKATEAKEFAVTHAAQQALAASHVPLGHHAVHMVKPKGNLAVRPLSSGASGSKIAADVKKPPSPVAPLGSLMVGCLQPLLLELSLPANASDAFLDPTLELGLSAPSNAQAGAPLSSTQGNSSSGTSQAGASRGSVAALAAAAAGMSRLLDGSAPLDPSVTSLQSSAPLTLPPPALQALAALPSSSNETASLLSPQEWAAMSESDALAEKENLERAQSVVNVARQASSALAKEWGPFFWSMNHETGQAKPIDIDALSGQPSETLSLSQLTWSSVGEGSKGRRVALVPVWVRPSQAGRLCSSSRVSYRPRADHPHRVEVVCAFEVRCIHPLKVDLAPATVSKHPCGVVGSVELKHEPAYMTKLEALVASRNEGKVAIEPATEVAAPTSVTSLNNLLPPAAQASVAATSTSASSPSTPATAAAAVGAAPEASAVAVHADAPGLCRVHVTNQHELPLVVHAIRLRRPSGTESESLLLHSTRNGGITLHAGDSYAAQFSFVAPPAAPGSTHETWSLEPANAQPLGSVEVAFARACDVLAEAGGTAEEGFTAPLSTSSHEMLSWSLPPAAIQAATFSNNSVPFSGSEGTETLMAQLVVDCPQVVSVAPPFHVACQRPVAAVAGVPFAVTYVLTNKTPHFQTLALRASLRPSFTSASAASGHSTMASVAVSAPVAQTNAGPSFSCLGSDGVWTPYSPPVSAALAAGLAASPRGGRIFLADPLSASSALAFATTDYVKAMEEDGGDFGAGYSGPFLAASAQKASYEVRWGAEARSAKLPPDATHHLADSSGLRLVQVSASGYAKLVQRDDPSSRGSSSYRGSSAASSGGVVGPTAAATAAAGAASVNGGASEGDSFLWSGLRSGTVALDPFSSLELTHTMIPLKAGVSLPLVTLDVASASLAGVGSNATRGTAAFVLRESCQGPTPVIFVAPTHSAIAGTAGQP